VMNEIILAGIKKQVRIGKLFHARSLIIAVYRQDLPLRTNVGFTTRAASCLPRIST